MALRFFWFAVSLKITLRALLSTPACLFCVERCRHFLWSVVLVPNSAASVWETEASAPAHEKKYKTKTTNKHNGKSKMTLFKCEYRFVAVSFRFFFLFRKTSSFFRNFSHRVRKRNVARVSTATGLCRFLNFVCWLTFPVDWNYYIKLESI